MYRIYYNSGNGWNLFSESDEENAAWDSWNECCDKYLYSKVRITKEEIINEK